MNAPAPAGLYEGHRVRVMWERPVGTLGRWRRRLLYRAAPIYVFVAYVRGRELPVRVGLRGEQETPFVIDDPLDFDGGSFNHGPYASAQRYDRDNPGHTLAGLFEMLYRSARFGTDDWSEADQDTLTRSLDGFYTWIWREHRRDRITAPGVVTAN